MKSWTVNLIEYCKNKTLGVCPKCGSSEIEVKILDIGRVSITFLCNRCKSSAHFDGVHKA